MKFLTVFCSFLILAATSAAEKPEPKSKLEKKEKGAPETKGSPSDQGSESGKAQAASVKDRPTPKLKTPESSEKLQEALSQMNTREYSKARVSLGAILKDAATPEDRKLINAL